MNSHPATLRSGAIFFACSHSRRKTVCVTSSALCGFLSCRNATPCTHAACRFTSLSSGSTWPSRQKVVSSASSEGSPFRGVVWSRPPGTILPRQYINDRIPESCDRFLRMHQDFASSCRHLNRILRGRGTRRFRPEIAWRIDTGDEDRRRFTGAGVGLAVKGDVL